MKEAKEFAESIAAIFIETSARNAVNVEELFQKISRFHVCMYFTVCCACVSCVSVYYFGSFREKTGLLKEKLEKPLSVYHNPARSCSLPVDVVL